MARNFDKKQRNTHVRERKPIMAIIAEGKNATERKYFSSFNSQKSKYVVQMVSGGGKTDPENLQKEIEKFWDQNGLSAEEGDLAFVVLDLDCDNKKAEVIRQQPKTNTHSGFIVSNPCFEVWFLEHFDYSSQAFNSSDEAIAKLKKLVPDYSKSKNMYDELKDKTDTAIENCIKLEKHQNELWPSNKCNPRTDVWKIVKMLVNDDLGIVR